MAKSITLEEAKQLTHGTVLVCIQNKSQKWRVTGKPKTWKRSPERVQVPLKHGLYHYGYLTEKNLDLFTLLN
jgi:hypothetical protein